MEDTDLVFYKSVTINDNAANGGRMSYTQVTSNVLNNLFWNITQDERTDGDTKYRKFFMKNKNSGLESAANSRIWISSRSTGGDYFRIKAGTNTDVQSDAEGYTDWLGTGYLTKDLSADSTTFEALFDTNNGIYNGSLLRITDNSGGEEFLTIEAIGGVSWVSNTATVIVTTPVRGSYLAGQNSLVMGVIDLGSIVATTDSWIETSVTGTYDETTYPVVVNNVGTVEDTWALTFTSPTSFTVTGTNTGSVGSGTKGSDFSPVNANVGTGDYYFTIPGSGWAGTWAIGETVTFLTHHSAKSIWIKEEIPALTSSKNSNTFKFKLYAEGS